MFTVVALVVDTVVVDVSIFTLESSVTDHVNDGDSRGDFSERSVVRLVICD